jgi:PKD repeat protein
VIVGVTTIQNFTLKQGGSIIGSVKDSLGNVVSSAFVYAWNEELGIGNGEPIQPDGTYMIKDLPTGRYSMGVDVPKGLDLGFALILNVSVVEGSTTIQNFTLTRAGYITGTVKDSSGNAVSDAFVSAWSESTGINDGTSTSFDGSYSIALPEGIYNIYVEAVEGSNLSDAYRIGVSVTPEMNTTQNFTLSQTGFIVGTVKNSLGNAVAEANVYAWSPDGLAGGEAQTATDGRYSIALPTGTYDMAVEASEGLSLGNIFVTGIIVTGGSTTSWNFTLQQGGSIIGTVRNSTGNPISEAKVVAWIPGEGAIWAETSSNGTYVLNGLQSNTYNVTALKEGYVSNTQSGVIVTTNSTTTNDFTMARIGISSSNIPSSEIQFYGKIAKGNIAPRANAGKDQTVNFGDAVSLSGAGSSDADGATLSYSWNFGDGTSKSGINQVYTYAAPGKYTVTLTVLDSNGSADNSTAVVTVNSIKSAPVANAGPDQAVTIGQTITLDGSGSTDSDGTISSYRWVEGNKTLSSSVAFSTNELSLGIHTITLTVTDNDGTIDTDSTIVTINQLPNIPPIANAGPDQTVAAGQTVILDGSGSSDSNGKTDSYRWSEGDKTLSSNVIFSTKDLTPGTHIITLTVTDNDKASSTDTVIITVTGTAIKGDTNNDGNVSDFELLDYIDKWATGTVNDFDLLAAIDVWAKG